MKNWFLIAMVLLGANAVAQDVPPEVEKAFNKRYLNAEDVYWYETDKGFVADFEAASGTKEVTYASSGKWVETRTTLKRSNVPQKLLASVESKFPGSEVEDVVMIEDAKGTRYEASSVKGGLTTLVKLNAEGKITETRKLAMNIPSDDDEDDDDDDW